MGRLWDKCVYQPFLRVLSDSMLLTTFTVTSLRTTDKLMQFTPRQDIKPQPNLGEQVEQWQESLVCLVVVLTELVKELSVTCVEEDECSHQPKLTEDGTEK